MKTIEIKDVIDFITDEKTRWKMYTCDGAHKGLDIEIGNCNFRVWVRGEIVYHGIHLTKAIETYNKY
jgi:hypothetical protein